MSALAIRLPDQAPAPSRLDPTGTTAGPRAWLVDILTGTST